MDVIINEYRTVVDSTVQAYEQVREEVKETTKVSTEGAKKTTDEFNKTTKSVTSLKAQLRELKQQIANSTDPKEIQRLSKAAGELSDKINDANESVAVFASGSKFEQINNAFGSIVSNIRNLDFSRASEQAQVLLTIVRSLTFAEVISGVKAFGETILNLGKALLTNPFTLIAAAIAGLVYVIYDAVGAFEDFSKSSKTLNESLKASEDRIKSLGEKQAEYLIKIAQAQGKLTKAQADAKLGELKNFQERTGLVQKFSDDVRKLAEELELDLSKTNNGKFSELYTGDYKDLLKRIKFNREFVQLQTRLRQELTYQNKVYASEQQVQTEERLAKVRQMEEDNAKKIKELREQEIEDQKRLNQVLRDLRTGNIIPDYDREKQALKDKLDDDIEQYKRNGAIIAELRIKYINDLNRLEVAQRQKEADEQKKTNDAAVAGNKARIDAIQKQEDEFDAAYSKRIERQLGEQIEGMNTVLKTDKEIADERLKLLNEVSSAISNGVNSLGQISKNISEKQLQEIDQRKESELASLEDQYKNQLITKEQYEKKKAQIEEQARKEESRIKREQFEKDKQIALIQVAISTAQSIAKTLANLGVPAGLPASFIAAALGALQAAAITSQPTPKFEYGGRVGGRRHSAGGTLIEAEEGEWITRRDMAIKHDRMLQAINEGQAEHYIKVHYIAPALKDQEARYQQMLSVHLKKEMQEFKDENLLESLKKTREQAKQNTLFLAKALRASKRSKNKW